MDAITIIAAVVCLLIGLAAGYLLTRTLSPGEKHRRQLEERIQAGEDELKIYQRDVSDHLLKTAELLQEINRNQRQLGEEIASSAVRLASPTVSRKVQDAALEGISTDAKTRILSAFPQEPPKDYAPRAGSLSEDYGFDEEEPSITTRGLNKAPESLAEEKGAPDNPSTHRAT